MIIARIVRSDGKWSIQLPDEFASEESEYSVRKSGDALILEPVVKTPSWERVLAWLDEPAPPVSQDFVDDIARIEAADTAMARMMGPPRIK